RIVRRNDFDAWLAEKTRESGIENREGVTVKNVSPQNDEVMVETSAGTFKAKVVVGADGSKGVTRRCILPNAPGHISRALEVITPEYDHIAGSGAAAMRQSNALFNDMHEKDHAYFDFFPVSEGIAGYTWDFPTQINGKPMRCWGIYESNLSVSKERLILKDLLAKDMARHGFDLGRYKIEGHPIRRFSPFNRFSVPRVILVGDAAGADGFFGEGISMALGYGLVAARAINDAFAQNEFSFCNYRRRILFSPLGQTLTIRTAISHILYRLHSMWLQKIFGPTFRPFVEAFSRIFVINWANRMK
ncbi:MAG: NAD(P)/FAD-dependent oxidoreductase, partial [Syntrophaceae bacterium]|nr:NAD(P)/FAD-dependent oxidoreductase [Syntrophaceae bacterium]